MNSKKYNIYCNTALINISKTIMSNKTFPEKINFQDSKLQLYQKVGKIPLAH